MKIKLVRDRVAQIDGETIAEIGMKPVRHALLIMKLHEEVEEIADRAYDPIEYADVLEALEELASVNGVSMEEIQKAKENKRLIKGGFTKGRVVIREGA